MALRAKALTALVVVSGVLMTGIAFAKSKKPNKSKTSPSDDIDLEEEEVAVSVPSPNGEAEIIMDADEAEEAAGDDSNLTSGVEQDLEEVLPEVIEDVSSSDNPVDQKLDDLAKQEGKEEKEAVAEVVKDMTSGGQIPPIASEETSPEMDPYGTVAFARILLAREEMPGWKSDLQSETREWQEAVGDLKPDGLLGIKSLQRMATEVGILPLVRYYPKSITSKAQAKRAYNAAIEQVINDLRNELPDSQAQIDGLTLSMKREQAQSFGAVNPPPQPTRAFIQDVNDAIAEAAELETEKELDNV